MSKSRVPSPVYVSVDLVFSMLQHPMADDGHNCRKMDQAKIEDKNYAEHASRA